MATVISGSAFAEDLRGTLPVVLGDDVEGQAVGTSEHDGSDTAPPAAWEFSAAITAGLRYYSENRPYPDFAYEHIPGLTDDQFFPYLSGWARAAHTSEDQRHRITLEAFGRYDVDGERDLFDLPEANYRYDAGSWNFLIGSHKEFWGVTESRHLVDIINQIDLDGDPDRESRLGQPMVNVNHISNIGTISLYGLFWFREQDFDGAFDRLPVDLAVNEGKAEFEDDDWRHAAFAARYSNTVNVGNASLDYALSYFNGTARDPRLVPEFDLSEHPPIYLVPYYDRIHQVGGELLFAYNGLQLKFEGIWRHQNDEDIFAAVTGFEYTVNSVLNTNADVGLVVEYLYDDRVGDDPFNVHTLVDNEIFAGTRITLNSGLNATLLAGMLFDLDDDGEFFAFEASSRITESTQISIEGRFFTDYPTDNAAYLLNEEDFVDVSLTKFF